MSFFFFKEIERSALIDTFKYKRRQTMQNNSWLYCLFLGYLTFQDVPYANRRFQIVELKVECKMLEAKCHSTQLDSLAVNSRDGYGY